MTKPLQYSTKYIDKELEYSSLVWEKQKQGVYENSFNHLEIALQRLEKDIQEGQKNRIIDDLCALRRYYSRQADYYMQFDSDIQKAKEEHYLAALASELCYELVRKGFPHSVMDSGRPYDFIKNNFNFSRHAILANEFALALKIAGNNTVEGALFQQKDEYACMRLPALPEDETICHDEVRQCMWAIAHHDGKMFNLYMRERIKMLRRQGSMMATTLDGWGLALIKLAQQRGISCDLDVIELPQALLDDVRVDTHELYLPLADEIKAILHEKR